jgi:hypothetical protein
MNLVDTYIFYDDVNYIKNGWINRNRIVINKEVNYLTLTLEGASSNKKINEVGIGKTDKLLKTIELSYKKHPYFLEVFPIISGILNYESTNLSKFVINANMSLASFLDIKTKLVIASELLHNQHLNGQERIIDICKTMEASSYINHIGGKTLYSNEVFKSNGIQLEFLKTLPFSYVQAGVSEFFPFLSTLDVLMNCGKEQTKQYLGNYEYEI